MKKTAILGEKRVHGGREYIKTADGWKYHGKGTGAKAQEYNTTSNAPNNIIIISNKDLMNRKPQDGTVIITPNYRIDVKKNQKDNSYSKSIITDRRNFKELSYFFDQVPKFIMDFLNR